MSRSFSIRGKKSTEERFELWLEEEGSGPIFLYAREKRSPLAQIILTIGPKGISLCDNEFGINLS